MGYILYISQKSCNLQLAVSPCFYKVISSYLPVIDKENAWFILILDGSSKHVTFLCTEALFFFYLTHTHYISSYHLNKSHGKTWEDCNGQEIH